MKKGTFSGIEEVKHLTNTARQLPREPRRKTIVQLAVFLVWTTDQPL